MHRLTPLPEELTCSLGGEYEAPPDAIIWRDAFCHECEMNECVQGTARQLAEKIIILGWFFDRFDNHAFCPKCQNPSPPPSPFWEKADRDIAAYKESIDA